MRVATGEHIANRVVFEQLIRARAVDVIQIDACRVGGVNENLAILLMAAVNDVPVCPHAGRIGLCEMAQHLALFDYVNVARRTDGRLVEYVDHRHEHLADPVVVEGVTGRRPPLSTRGGPRFTIRPMSDTTPTGWEVVDGKLHRELTFQNFSEAWAFMARVALAAEKADHHPDWSNSWNRVVIDLVTHDAGGITERDHALAEKINGFIG